MIDFCVVGPQRTATSWLHDALQLHPFIALPLNVKEIFFFDRNFKRGKAWHEAHFSASSDQLIGEVSPTYFGSKSALENLKAQCPLCKILIILRDPIEITFSLYAHERMKGREFGSIEDALRENSGYYKQGWYSIYLPKWVEAFPQQIKLVQYRDIESEPHKVLKNICAFLGVSPLAIDHFPTRIGPSLQPRNQLVSKFVYASSNVLRELGLNRLVNLGKRSGLTRVLNKERDVMTQQERQVVEEFLTPELQFFSKLENFSQQIF